MLITTLCIGLAFSIPAASGDDAADAVLGQTDFTGTAPNAPSGTATARNLALLNAAQSAIASNGRLYLSDPGNNRVLSWPTASAFQNGDAADRVFGQPNFTSTTANNGGVSANSLSLPQGICVDGAGNLWVADAFNSRVLRFNNPDADATPTTADLVMGQPDFTHNDQNLANGDHGTTVALPDSLQFPGRVLVRGADVYVADSGNSRVLHYTAPTTNKPLADRVYGQMDSFTCRAKNNDGACNNGCCATQVNFYNPIGIALSSSGALYVADWFNHRVLRFDHPLSSTTPDGVIGQPDFVTNTPNNTGIESGLQLPIDLAFDASDHLFIADAGNNRVVVFNDPAHTDLPDAVFGQLGSTMTGDPNHGLGFFTTNAQGLFGPTAVAMDALQNVYIVDANNNRLLRFDQPFVLAGDANCDGVVNAADAPAMSLILVNQNVSPGCALANLDLNHDGVVDGADIAPFVALLLGS